MNQALASPLGKNGGSPEDENSISGEPQLQSGKNLNSIKCNICQKTFPNLTVLTQHSANCVAPLQEDAVESDDDDDDNVADEVSCLVS